MSPGDVKNVSLSPENAYGPVYQELIASVPNDSLPEDFNFEVGDPFTASTSDGDVLNGIIESLGEESVILNFNHPMAGKTINFEIELVSIDHDGDSTE